MASRRRGGAVRVTRSATHQAELAGRPRRVDGGGRSLGPKSWGRHKANDGGVPEEAQVDGGGGSSAVGAVTRPRRLGAQQQRRLGSRDGGSETERGRPKASGHGRLGVEVISQAEGCARPDRGSLQAGHRSEQTARRLGDAASQ